MLDAGVLGSSPGNRWFGGTFAALFFGSALVFAVDGMRNGPGGLVAAAICVGLSSVVVQFGFQPQVAWSTDGVVFRGPFVTRTIPWLAVTAFAAHPTGTRVTAVRSGPGSWPILSPTLFALLAARPPSDLARVVEALNEYRVRMGVTPAPAPDARSVVTRLTRPGRPAVIWLCTELLLIAVTALVLAAI